MTLLHQTRLPLSDISCILFDMDGTLLDSAPGVTASAAAALAAVGAPVPSMDKLRRFVGPPMIESFRKVSQLDDKTAQRALQCYRQEYADHGAEASSPYDGIVELLEQLHSAGMPMAVATGVDISAPAMVGDRSYDVEGAGRHGIPTIFALWGYGDASEASQAAAVASSPSGLLPLILNNRRRPEQI
jgi:phosphoglycolate phosphatase